MSRGRLLGQVSGSAHWHKKWLHPVIGRSHCIRKPPVTSYVSGIPMLSLPLAKAGNYMASGNGGMPAKTTGAAAQCSFLWS